LAAVVEREIPVETCSTTIIPLQYLSSRQSPSSKDLVLSYLGEMRGTALSSSPPLVDIEIPVCCTPFFLIEYFGMMSSHAIVARSFELPRV